MLNMISSKQEITSKIDKSSLLGMLNMISSKLNAIPKIIADRLLGMLNMISSKQIIQGYDYILVC